jgi:O-methyltransferase
LNAFHAQFAESVPCGELIFFNYGYAEPRNESYAWIDSRDLAYKYHLSLVRHTLETAELDGKSVLDIGAYRGGNCHYLLRYGNAARVTALDYCPAYLELSRSLLRDPRAQLVCGDAQRLPCASSAYDVALNIQSSHCYADFPSFLSEVHRILKPGGIFAYADVWFLSAFGHDYRQREADLANSGFAISRSLDVTEQVFQALRAPDGFCAALRAAIDPDNRAMIEHLIQMHDAARWELAIGRARYRIYTLKKLR